MDQSILHHDTITSAEYTLIRDVYQNVRASSKVLMIEHINEGLRVLDMIGASRDSMRAFCIHPIVQSDEALVKHFIHIQNVCSPMVVMLAMEYRNVANRFLPRHKGSIELSPLVEVNDMLIADKVQNRKDFELYHKGKHRHSVTLTRYFNKWLNALGVEEGTYQSYKASLIKGNHE